MSSNPQKFLVSEACDRLDRFLVREKIATSRSEAQRWIELGHVLVNAQSPKASQSVLVGQTIAVAKPSLKPTDLIPKEVSFEILFEDDDIAVLNKPAGLVVHPGAGNTDESLVHGLLFRLGDSLSGIGGVERPGIVHRLDKGTSGVMVIAKNDASHRDLSKQFQEHTIEKKYEALVVGKVLKPEQKLVHLMKRAEMNRKKFVVNQKKGKQAITHVTVMRQNERLSLVSVKIETGRTHQIRVHLSFIGHPIVGDETYGGTKKLVTFNEDEKKYIRDLGRPLLHAHTLAFTHPRNRKRLSFTVPLSSDFLGAMQKLMPEK